MPAANAATDCPNAVLLGIGADDWLTGAANIIRCHRSVGSEVLAIRRLDEILDGRDRVDAVELVAHSLSRPAANLNLLKLGRWIVGATAFGTEAPRLREKLAAKHCKVLRLVGCHTAVGPAADATIAALEAALGVAVYGTNRVVGDYDLAACGTNPARRAGLFERRSERRASLPVRVDRSELVAAGATEHGMPARASDDALRHGLSGAPRALVTELLELVAPVSYFELPGVLAEPCDGYTAALGRASSAGFVRADSLFDGQVLRLRRYAAREPVTDRLVLVGEPQRPLIARRFAALRFEDATRAQRVVADVAQPRVRDRHHQER